MAWDPSLDMDIETELTFSVRADYFPPKDAPPSPTGWPGEERNFPAEGGELKLTSLRVTRDGKKSDELLGSVPLWLIHLLEAQLFEEYELD